MFTLKAYICVVITYCRSYNSKSHSKLSLAAYAMKVKQIPKDNTEYKNVEMAPDESWKLSFKPGVKINEACNMRMASFGGSPQSGSLEDNVGQIRFSNFYENLLAKSDDNEDKSESEEVISFDILSKR